MYEQLVVSHVYKHCMSVPYMSALNRFTGCVEVDLQGPGAPDADRPARHVRHSHFRHHRARVLLGGPAQDLLQHRRPK